MRGVHTPRSPAWSPDGLQIAFVADGPFTLTGEKVYLMDADGTNVIRLSDTNYVEIEPTWSPDGTRIAYASNRDGNWEIYSMKADGSEPQRVTNNKFQDTDPFWRP